MKLNQFFNTVFLIIMNFVVIICYTYFVNNSETVFKQISNINKWEYLGLFVILLFISFKNVNFEE